MLWSFIKVKVASLGRYHPCDNLNLDPTGALSLFPILSHALTFSRSSFNEFTRALTASVLCGLVDEWSEEGDPLVECRQLVTT